MLELMSSEPADANAADEGVAKLQMVMEMDMQTWKVRALGPVARPSAHADPRTP